MNSSTGVALAILIDDSYTRIYTLVYMQTTVMFKTDKKLKAAAQATAKRMGIPFSAVLNQFLRDIVARKEILFIAKDEKSKV